MVSNPLFYKFNLYYLIIALLIVMVVQVWGVNEVYDFHISSIIADALISWILIAVFVFLITNTLSYYHPPRGRILIAFLIPLLLSYVWLQASQTILRFFVVSKEYEAFIANTSFYRFTVGYLLFASSILLNLIWHRLGEKEEMQRRKEESEKMVKEAELFKLRQQLQPHFLFNSLNSISSLIGSRPEEARGMITKLSEFLRGTVRREDQQLVLLENELEYLKLYLDIEQTRFGHRLSVEHDHSPEATKCKLPPLLVQPLLENAIKYGLYGTTEAITIKLQSTVVDHMLQLTVSNPFDEDFPAEEGTGFGLPSIRRRLYLLYGRQDLLKIKATGGEFTAILKIPIPYDKSIAD